MSAPIGSARRFGALGDGRGRADVLGAVAIARCEESLAEALEVLFPRPSVARFGSVALCAAAVTSAWSLATLPRVALGRLGRSPIGCDPYQPFRRLRALRAVARGASSLKQLHVPWGDVEGWRLIATGEINQT